MTINKNYAKERNVNVIFVKVLKLSETFYGGTYMLRLNVDSRECYCDDVGTWSNLERLDTKITT